MWNWIKNLFIPRYQYAVYDGSVSGRKRDAKLTPAKYPNSVYSCWHTNIFPTFKEAREYAMLWLGPQYYIRGLSDIIKLNKPYYYNGLDYIIIKKERIK